METPTITYRDYSSAVAAVEPTVEFKDWSWVRGGDAEWVCWVAEAEVEAVVKAATGGVCFPFFPRPFPFCVVRGWELIRIVPGSSRLHGVGPRPPPKLAWACLPRLLIHLHLLLPKLVVQLLVLVRSILLATLSRLLLE